MNRPWDAVAWWEVRRLPYNATLAGLGLITLLVGGFVGSRMAPANNGGMGAFGLSVSVVAYGLGANAAYTLGWITELLWSGGDTAKTAALRPRVFWTGLLCSSALTLLPAILLPAAWALSGFR